MNITHVTYLEYSKTEYLILPQWCVCLPHIIFCKAIILQQKYYWKTLFDGFLYLDIHSELKELDKVIGDGEENNEDDKELSFQRWLKMKKFWMLHVLVSPSYLMNLPERGEPLHRDGHHRVHWACHGHVSQWDNVRSSQHLSGGLEREMFKFRQIF